MQKAEGRRQKAEGRRQKAEGRRQKAEGRRQKAENFWGCKILKYFQSSRAHSRFTIHDSRFTIHDSRFTISRFTIIASYSPFTIHEKSPPILGGPVIKSDG
jgi:hypothetical protein